MFTSQMNVQKWLALSIILTVLLQAPIATLIPSFQFSCFKTVTRYFSKFFIYICQNACFYMPFYFHLLQWSSMHYNYYHVHIYMYNTGDNSMYQVELWIIYHSLYTYSLFFFLWFPLNNSFDDWPWKGGRNWIKRCYFTMNGRFF